MVLVWLSLSSTKEILFDGAGRTAKKHTILSKDGMF